MATSLSLLLKKLAKEDHHSLGFLSPNYIIGGQQQQHTTTTTTSPSSSCTNADLDQHANAAAAAGSCLKQEEILKKFYSGDVNLLICTCEMERSIESPTCVNLIVRFNCSSSTTTTTTSTSSVVPTTATAAFDYFAYIETKSRAKSKQAHCHFFIEQSHFAAFFAQLNTYKQIESLLINNYSTLISFNRPIISYPLSTSHGKFTLENSIFFLNRYKSCLRLAKMAKVLTKIIIMAQFLISLLLSCSIRIYFLCVYDPNFVNIFLGNVHIICCDRLK